VVAHSLPASHIHEQLLLLVGCMAERGRAKRRGSADHCRGQLQKSGWAMCGVAAILTLPPATLYLYQLLGIQFTPHWVLFVAL